MEKFGSKICRILLINVAFEWGLTNLKPVDNLSFNYVLSGVQNNVSIILKLSFESDLLQREAQAMRAFINYGAVGVLAYGDKKLLLKKAIPGKSLKNNPNKVSIACNIAKKLHQSPLPENHNLILIEDRLNALDKNWNIPGDYLKKARALKREIRHCPIIIYRSLSLSYLSKIIKLS